jgi:hypothetical protein
MLIILPGGAGTEAVCAADMDHVTSSDAPQARITFIDVSPSENVELGTGTLRENRIPAKAGGHFSP